jgi:hypothetical protein
VIGVAAGLILQSRQLRASHVQVIREMHLELTKMAMENPELVASMYSDVKDMNVDELRKTSFLNFQMTLIRTAYSLKTVSGQAVESQVRDLFASEFVRTWWSMSARNNYATEGVSRADREFFEIADRAFKQATQALQQDVNPQINS